MLKALRSWINDGEDEKPSVMDEKAREAIQRRLESRLDMRHEFTGARMTLRTRRVLSVINLKDMSCRGACGISEMPLSVGAMVFLEIKKKRFHAAEVRWVRNALIGLQFMRPLDPDMVEKAHASHVAKKVKPAGARRAR